MVMQQQGYNALPEPCAVCRPSRLRRAVQCAGALSKPGSFNPDKAAATPLPELDEEGTRAHAQFMTYVFDLIDGARDSSQFEDDVRALLGARGAACALPCHAHSLYGPSPWSILEACAQYVLLDMQLAASLLISFRQAEFHSLATFKACSVLFWAVPFTTHR